MEKIRVLKQIDRRITAAEMGEAWPFTVLDGLLRVVKFNAVYGTSELGPMVAVLFEAPDETVYSVNGIADSWAREYGWEDIRPIWTDTDTELGLKKDISPLIEAGRRLAEATEADESD